MVEKVPIDKKQEFLVNFSYDSTSAIYFKILTRSIGQYRGVKASAVSLMNGNVIFRGTSTPVGIEIDEYRIARKWDGV